MEITQTQFEQIAHCLPKQRGNVRVSSLDLVNAILYVTEHACRWRALPAQFGKWHTVYMRINRWSKNGVLDRVFEELQLAGIVRIKIEALPQGGADASAAPGKTGQPPLADAEADEVPRFLWTPRLIG